MKTTQARLERLEARVQTNGVGLILVEFRGAGAEEATAIYCEGVRVGRIDGETLEELTERAKGLLPGIVAFVEYNNRRYDW